FELLTQALLLLAIRPPPSSTLFPYTTLFRSYGILNELLRMVGLESWIVPWLDDPNIVIYSVTVPVIWQWIGLYLIIFMSAIQSIDRKSTRLNSSHVKISYAVFCLKKK